MRILFTMHWPADSRLGPGQVVTALTREYEGAGHEVRVLTLDDLPRWLPYALQRALFPLLVALRLGARPGSLRPDVVDASTEDTWMWRLLFRRSSRRTRLVVRCHGLENVDHQARLVEQSTGHLRLRWRYWAYNGSLRLRLEALSLRSADVVLFLNEDEQRFAVERLGVDRERTAVVRNGLPPYLLGLPRPTAPTGALQIATVGSFDSRKGIDYAVPALTAVLSRRPEVRALLAGTRRSRADVLARFPENVRERVSVVPVFEHADLPRLLANSHITLFASLFEPFGLGLLEATAVGLAPVASDLPPLRQIVVDGETGLLVPPRDPPAIDAALEALLSDPDLLLRLRRGAHRRAQQFTWTEAARQSLALYTREDVRERTEHDLAG